MQARYVFKYKTLIPVKLRLESLQAALYESLWNKLGWVYCLYRNPSEVFVPEKHYLNVHEANCYLKGVGYAKVN